MTCTHTWAPVPGTRGTYRCTRCPAFGYRPEAGGAVRAHKDQKQARRRVETHKLHLPERTRLTPERAEQRGLGMAPVDGEMPDSERFVYPEEEKTR